MEGEILGQQFRDIFYIGNYPQCDSTPGANFFDMEGTFQVTGVPDQNWVEKFKPEDEGSELEEALDFLVDVEDEKPKSAVQFGSPSPGSSVSGASEKSQKFTVAKKKKSGENIKWKNKMRSPEQGVTRYAFKTKSECENFEDGYKWRKYGKKMLKNNPTSRSYYRCSNKECGVKKRVERDARDLGIVITTYEGIHNHESHSVVFCLGKKMTMPI